MIKIDPKEIISFFCRVPSLAADLFRHRLDLKLYSESYLCFLTALLVYPAAKYLPVECGYENGLVENTQMVILFVSMIFCWRAKNNRCFFRFFSAVVFLLILRETNFGKTLFYPDPDHPNEFLRWSEIPYAPYVDPAMIFYGIGMAVYFLRKNLFRVIPAFLAKGYLPVWNIVLMVSGIIAGTIVDKKGDDLIAEEMVELIFYIAFAGSIRRAASAGCRWLPETEN